MMTAAALATFLLGAWGAFETACDLATDRRVNRKVRFTTRCGDVAWLVLCGSVCLTAAHSLAATWGN